MADNENFFQCVRIVEVGGMISGAEILMSVKLQVLHGKS